MKTEVVLVTPEMAAEWLTRNSSNRPMRRNTVEHYARQMVAGEWQLTHQGICFDAHGSLVDGQHRLTAIVNAGIPVRMLVSAMDTEATAMGLALDIGALRSYSDVLQIPKREIEIARLLFEVAAAGSHYRRTSTSEVAAIHSHLKAELERIPRAVFAALCAHRVATLLAAVKEPSRAIQIYEQASWFATGSNCTQWWSSVEGFHKTHKQAKAAHWNGNGGRLEYIIRWRTAMLNPSLKISRILNEVLAAREVREQAREIVTASGVTL